MKKISLLLVVLLAAGSAGLYGQMAIGTEFSISGDAKATVGYDIDDEKLGFKNESSSNISLELVAKQSVDNAEMVGMQGWVGVIELKDFKIIIDPGHDDAHLHLTTSEVKFIRDAASGGVAALNALVKGDPEAEKHAADIIAIYTDQTIVTEGRTTNYLPNGALEPAAQNMVDELIGKIIDELDGSFTQHNHGLLVSKPSITATLKNGPLWLQIFDAPGNVAGLIDAVENDEDGDNDAESNDGANDVHTDLSGQGITVGYTTDDLGVALGITSDVPYDSAKDGGWVVSADVDVNVGPAALELQVVQGIQVDDVGSDDTGVAALLTTTFGSVSFSGGADMVMTGDDNDPDTPEDESMMYEVGVGADTDLTENTMFGADYIYSSKQNVASDVEVTFKDTGGLVDRLNMGLTWGLYDLTNGKKDGPATENDVRDMFVKGDLSYALDAMGGKLTPGAEVTLNQIDADDATVSLAVKAVLTEAIPATEFGLQWKTTDLVGVGDADPQQGTITAWAKIKYS